MRRPGRQHERSNNPRGSAAHLALTMALGALLSLGAGCNATVSAPPTGSSGGTAPLASGGTGAGTGTGGTTPQGVGGGVGSGGTGQGGSAGNVSMGAGAGAGAPQAGSGQGDDPYAIPASPPAPVFVATPRVARLSRLQWSN